MIPFSLHQTWMSNELPNMLKRCRKSWLRQNPGLEYHFYDDRACQAFIREQCPEYISVYEAFPFPIQRADLFRYLVVYQLGGFYADIDMECLRPMDPFCQYNDALFSLEARLTRTRQNELGYRYPYQVANCIFAAEKGNPFLGRLIEKIAELSQSPQIFEIEHVEDVTGPRLLTRLFYDSLDEQVNVLEQIFWMPPTVYPWIAPINKNMFARHLFLGSWKGQLAESKTLRRIWIERNLIPTPFPASRLHSFA